MERASLQSLPFYGRIEKTLEQYKDSDPTWMDIINALSELNESGDYASVLGAFEAYFDENGLVRNMERLNTQGMPSTPKITLEELNVTVDPENDKVLNLEYISFDKNGSTEITRDTMEEEYCMFEPGKYVTIAFEFTPHQSYTKKYLFNALENYYHELEALEALDSKGDYLASKIQVPVFSIVAVPLLFGGKYSLHLVNPLTWNWFSGEEGAENKMSESETLVVAFDRNDVHFIADDTADPAETFLKCRSELASEWMREKQLKRLEEEEEAYKKKHEEEIRKMNDISQKHAFSASKLDNTGEK